MAQIKLQADGLNLADTFAFTGTVTGGGAALTGSTNNTIPTVTGADAISGEANLTFDGTTLAVTGTVEPSGDTSSGDNAAIGYTATEGLILTGQGSTSDVTIKNDADGTVLSIPTGTTNVGIGTTAPADQLHVVAANTSGISAAKLEANSAYGVPLEINNSRADAAAEHSIIIKRDGTTIGAIGGTDTAFSIFNSSAEAIRIGSTGTVSIPSSTDAGRIDITGGSADPYIVWRGPGTGTNTKAMFLVNSVEVGTINTTSSATAYNTSSDYRLKENKTSITDGIDRIKQLKPYRFNFKVDADKTVDGFFAHEVSDIVPEAISGEKDAMHPEVLYVEGDELPEGKEIGDVKEETKIDPQGIDQAKLVPLLTSALQEAITKIETLENKVTALENA